MGYGDCLLAKIGEQNYEHKKKYNISNMVLTIGKTFKKVFPLSFHNDALHKQDRPTQMSKENLNISGYGGIAQLRVNFHC